MNAGTSSTFITKPFYLTKDNIEDLIIKETKALDNCFIGDANDPLIIYNPFILDVTQRTKLQCEITFYPSKNNGKYIPRLVFSKLDQDGNPKDAQNPEKVRIDLSKSQTAEAFWQLINFLGNYKDLVDIGDFQKSYRVVTTDDYIQEFKTKSERQKLKDLMEIVNIADLSESDFTDLTFKNRKENLKAFYYLLQNKIFPNGIDSYTTYRDKYNVRPGEEYIWHHFLKRHDWILGLNADLKFISLTTFFTAFTFVLTASCCILCM